MTQQIDLFGSKQERHEPKSPGRLEERRPSSIHVTKIHSDNLKWRECKIIGKNISIRSYSAACAFNNKYSFVEVGFTCTADTRCSMAHLTTSIAFP